jgi:Mg2+/Co2+ transporter CorC
MQLLPTNNRPNKNAVMCIRKSYRRRLRDFDEVIAARIVLDIYNITQACLDDIMTLRTNVPVRPKKVKAERNLDDFTLCRKSKPPVIPTSKAQWFSVLELSE